MLIIQRLNELLLLLLNILFLITFELLNCCIKIVLITYNNKISFEQIIVIIIKTNTKTLLIKIS